MDFDIADVTRDKRHLVYPGRGAKQIANRVIWIDRTHAAPCFRDLFTYRDEASVIIMSQGAQSLFQMRDTTPISRLISPAKLFDPFANFASRDDADQQIGLLRLFKPSQDSAIGSGEDLLLLRRSFYLLGFHLSLSSGLRV
jgi:hypothetical protein